MERLTDKETEAIIELTNLAYELGFTEFVGFLYHKDALRQVVFGVHPKENNGVAIAGYQANLTESVQVQG